MRLTLTPLSEADAAALIEANGHDGATAPKREMLIRFWSATDGVCYVLDAGTIYRVTVEETA